MSGHEHLAVLMKAPVCCKVRVWWTATKMGFGWGAAVTLLDLPNTATFPIPLFISTLSYILLSCFSAEMEEQRRGFSLKEASPTIHLSFWMMTL